MTIRNFSTEDQQLFTGLFEDEAVARYLPYRTPDEYMELFNDSIDHYGKVVLNRWGIFKTRTNHFIGMCLARDFADVPGQVEIGYVLAKKYWGKGIASETARALAYYCFSNTDTKQVVAVTDLDNTASQRVLEKAGFRRLKNLKRLEAELAYFMIERANENTLLKTYI